MVLFQINAVVMNYLFIKGSYKNVSQFSFKGFLHW